MMLGRRVETYMYKKIANTTYNEWQGARRFVVRKPGSSLSFTACYFYDLRQMDLSYSISKMGWVRLPFQSLLILVLESSNSKLFLLSKL